MKLIDLKKVGLPDTPGVYFFLKTSPRPSPARRGGGPFPFQGKAGDEVLYIGKATSLRDRVKSYLSKDLIATRGPLLVDMVVQADKVDYQQTDSVLEALILEAELIKKHQPKYNTKEKDNKSFNYVVITKEKSPKVLVIRGRKIKNEKLKIPEYQAVFGPFPNGMQLRVAMKIIRRIFPYFDNDSNKKQNYQFYKQLSLIPESDRQNNIKNLILFFQGKKKIIISNLKKEMMVFAKNKEFEKAGEVKRKIFALTHINDVALIKEETSQMIQNSAALPSLRGLRHGQNFVSSVSFRIEAYDIAHMAGSNMVGVMTVVTNGQKDNQEYRKFIIRTQKDANDTGALEEVFSRRFRHTEWGLPNLIVMDGSTAQINVAKQVLARYQFEIPVVGVVKDDKHKARAIIGDETLIKKYKKDILLANSEAHRFAITFHKNTRNKNFLK